MPFRPGEVAGHRKSKHSHEAERVNSDRGRAGDQAVADGQPERQPATKKRKREADDVDDEVGQPRRAMRIVGKRIYWREP